MRTYVRRYLFDNLQHALKQVKRVFGFERFVGSLSAEVMILGVFAKGLVSV